MPTIKISDLDKFEVVSPQVAAMVKGGPLEIRELQIRVRVDGSK